MVTAIVTTTIHSLDFLEKYFENFKKYYVKPEEVEFIIVGDNKTPDPGKIVFDYPVQYWSPISQKKWIETNLPNMDVSDVIPENNPRRRNFGYIIAKQFGYDNVIVIDDDNLPSDTDFLRLHTRFGIRRYREVFSRNKIFNPCKLLSTNYVYSRGYPISEMYHDTYHLSDYYINGNVVLNLGLWFNKPDVDAYWNIVYPDLDSIEFVVARKFHVGINNYIPLNTQNTSFTSKVLPIFWNLYQEYFDRFDDIWTGLFVNKIVNKNNDRISFGSPFSRHVRNSHNYSKDLAIEMKGILMNSTIWKYIMDLDISKGYIDGYLEIANNLQKFREFSDYRENLIIKTIGEKMIKWIKIMEMI